jgi:hypothetical protein
LIFEINIFEHQLFWECNIDIADLYRCTDLGLQVVGHLSDDIVLNRRQPQ